MKIKADKTGIEVIKQLCDLALKQGGLQNLNAVTQVLQSIEEIEKKSENTKS